VRGGLWDGRWCVGTMRLACKGGYPWSFPGLSLSAMSSLAV
jgi:hypothetical protein